MNNRILRLKQPKIKKESKSNLWINSDDFVIELKKLESKINELKLETQTYLKLSYELAEFENTLINKIEVIK